eukprot:ANDGO_00934.mRNA.1 Coiled-coil domain-containing protein lobo
MAVTTAVPFSKRNRDPLILAYVDTFRTQYTQLFPSRSPLFLTAENSDGDEKFVCLSVRPTELPYIELYDLPNIVRFISGYVVYEPMDPPTVLPEVLVGPAATMTRQSGNCFELSVLMTSLLIGAGYDAYVVYGYASRATCNNDLSGTVCDVDVSCELDSVKKEDDKAAPKTRYKLRRRDPLVSRYEKNQEEKLANEMRNQKLAATSDGDGAEEAAKALERVPKHADEGGDGADDFRDELYGKRVHAWVLVLAGKRDMQKHIFIEPSTGKMLNVESDEACFRYFGIEALFNHQNYWVNMQSLPKGIYGMNFDLTDLKNWEYVVIDEMAFGMPPEHALNATSGAGGKDGVLLDISASPIRGNNSKVSFDVSESLTPSALVAGSSINREGVSDAARMLSTSRGDLADLTVEAGELGDQILDLPRSWVRSLELSKYAFESRYPDGRKFLEFQDASVEMYAPYVHPEGIVLRVTYHDRARGVISLFSNRKDKLRKRVVFDDVKAGRTSVELFLPGKRGENQYEALSRLVQIQGRSRELQFYASARTDGLESRMEYFDPTYPSVSGYLKTVETFVGRGDHLVRRKVVYSATGVQTSGAPTAVPVLSVGSSGDLNHTANLMSSSLFNVPVNIIKPILKISEQFAETNPERIAKRVFDRLARSVRVIYHYAPDAITQTTYTFAQVGKDKLDIDMSVKDPFARQPDDQQLMDMYQNLLISERVSEQSVRESEKEAGEIFVQRDRDESNVLFETSVYDTLRNKPSQEEIAALRAAQEEEARKRSMRDYLTPFLPRPEGVFTREEAIATKEAALKALKERLIDRATIIQSRLDEEKANHARRKQAFVRNEGHMDKAEEEEFLAYCEDAMFRIHILEQRLARHEELAVAKYAELENKLRVDNRLATFLNA